MSLKFYHLRSLKETNIYLFVGHIMKYLINFNAKFLAPYNHKIHHVFQSNLSYNVSKAGNSSILKFAIFCDQYVWK